MQYLADHFFISLVLTPLLIKLAKRFNVLDIPKGNLKTHKTSIPYLGGIAIYLAFVISLIIERFIASGNIYGLIGIIVGGTAVFFWDW